MFNCSSQLIKTIKNIITTYFKCGLLFIVQGNKLYGRVYSYEEVGNTKVTALHQMLLSEQ